MTKQAKIVFLGTPRFAQIVLSRLINSPYKPSLIITAPDTRAGRGRRLESSPVKQTAVKNKIEVIEPKSLDDEHWNFDIAILVAYGKIIPQKILDSPKFGFLNVHPSMLPKYRGPSPIQTAILNGDQKTGVTIMKLDAEIDHGPILVQQPTQIEPSDTHLTLIEKLATIGSNLLLDSLPKYLEGNLKPQPQEHSKASFSKHITKNDGQINIYQPPDKEALSRMIRAYFPWPGVWFKVKVSSHKEIIIKLLPASDNLPADTMHHALPTDRMPAAVLIQPEGRRPMTKKEFLNGYPQITPLVEKLL